MAKEMKLNETENEINLTENEMNEVETIEEVVDNTLYVKREAFKSNGKVYYGYFIPFEMRGHKGKVEMVPANNKGYLNLEIVYGDSDEAPLTIKTTSTKSKDGTRQKFTSYFVSNVDEMGFPWVSDIKPASLSDTSLLNMLIERMKFEKSQKGNF